MRTLVCLFPRLVAAAREEREGGRHLGSKEGIQGVHVEDVRPLLINFGRLVLGSIGATFCIELLMSEIFMLPLQQFSRIFQKIFFIFQNFANNYFANFMNLARRPSAAGPGHGRGRGRVAEREEPRRHGRPHARHLEGDG